MEEFEDYWVNKDGRSPLVANNGSEAGDDIPSHIYQFTAAQALWTADDPNKRAQSTTDDASQIFEFFDWQNACSDAFLLDSSRTEQRLISTTLSATICSPVSQEFTLIGSPTTSDVHLHSFTSPATFDSPVQDKQDSELVAQPGATPNPMVRAIQTSANQMHPTRKRPLEDDQISTSHVDSGTSTHPAKRRPKMTLEQLDHAKRVRATGACLRCYVQKLKCSAGRPCQTCLRVFQKASDSKVIQWTACVTSSLPDLNIFTLGISIFGSGPPPLGGQQQKYDLRITHSVYTAILENGGFTDATLPLDGLYMKVLQHRYGRRASEVHPFILDSLDPLHILVKLNVILLGSPVIGVHLIGHVRYLQKLRRSLCHCRIRRAGKGLRPNHLGDIEQEPPVSSDSPGCTAA